MKLDIQFYTDGADSRLLARFKVRLAAPWGVQLVCGEIHHWHQTGARRVMWYKAGHLFASTPETATETADAERMILDAFARWEGKR